MGIPMLREKETHVGCCKEQSAILKHLITMEFELPQELILLNMHNMPIAYDRLG